MYITGSSAPYIVVVDVLEPCCCQAGELLGSAWNPYELPNLSVNEPTVKSALYPEGIEDAITPALANYVPIDESDKIIYENNEGAFRKCRSYNIGLQYATRPFICFIDIDVILDPEQTFRVKKNIQRKQKIKSNNTPWLQYSAVDSPDSETKAPY